MARSYRFSIISFEPDGLRRERLNVGIIVFRDMDVDVHLTPKLHKLRSISAAIDFSVIQSAAQSFLNIDNSLRATGLHDIQKRFEYLSHVGPFKCLSLGTFRAESQSIYWECVQSLMRRFVDPEQAAFPKLKNRRNKLSTQIKKMLKNNLILALPSEGLESHRVISNYEIDKGLVADLVLKNGHLHVIETIDAALEVETLRRAVSDVAVSALILERARMTFGPEFTRGRIVYSASSTLENAMKPSLDAAAHQGAELINWESRLDRSAFLEDLVSLATPIASDKTRERLVSGNLKLIVH